MNRKQVDEFLKRHELDKYVEPLNEAIELCPYDLPKQVTEIDGTDDYNYAGYAMLAYIIEKAKEDHRMQI